MSSTNVGLTRTPHCNGQRWLVPASMPTSQSTKPRRRSSTMLNTKIVTITPPMAERMIAKDEKFYQSNPTLHARNIKQYVVEAYARDMQEGRWKLNGETLKIGDAGRIMDGRHRLSACVASNTEFKTLVAYDVRHEVFDTIDIGAIRTAGDMAGISGVPNGNVVAHAARIVYG